MNSIELESELLDVLRTHLTSDDDERLWREVLRVTSEDFEQRFAERNSKADIFMQVGACSHWLRPHQTRWTAAGGFAWPSGYGGSAGYSRNGLPEFDWSVLFQCVDGKWRFAEKFAGKKQISLRVAVPSRTSRHNQAAVHTISSPGRELVFYGFRKVEGEWKCIARSTD
jgi:hypothetical protein